VKTIKKWPWNL